MRTMESNLDELQMKWDQLKHRAEREGMDVGEEYRKERQTFDAKVAEAKARLVDADDLTGEARQGAEEAAWRAYEELKEAYERMASRYEQLSHAD
jgi:aminoglycoside N3'-acetyltransferase